MRYFNSIVHSIVILSIPALSLNSQNDFQPICQEADLQKCENIGLVSPYDKILNLINDVESDDFEDKYSEADLEEINIYLSDLAEKGMLPGDEEEASKLACDIHELLYGRINAYGYAYCYCKSNDKIFVPAVYYGTEGYLIYKAGWIKKQCKQVKHFVKKHKKAIIIGAAVVVLTAVAIYAITAASAAAAAKAAAAGAGAAGAAASSDPNNKHNDTLPPSVNNNTIASPALDRAIQQETVDFKNYIVKEGLLSSDLPIEENVRVLGQAWAYKSSDDIKQQASFESDIYRELMKMGAPGDLRTTKPDYSAIDMGFSSNDITYYVPVCSPEKDLKENIYQLRGERALELKFYNQAVSDFNKVIDLSPNDHENYLNRATAYLGTGNYDRSMNDYEQYVAKKPGAIEYVGNFSIGFADGLYHGVKESGTQLGAFAVDVACHPIDTAEEVRQGFVTLSKLVASQEWAAISQALVPEVCEAVQNWNNLSPREQGELSGKIVGKYGTDILIPCAAAKLAAGSAKGVKEIATACRSFKNAGKVLALETASETAIIPTTCANIGNFEEIAANPILLKSYEKFKKAEVFLHPYKRSYLPEKQVRDLIHQTGIETFPRPKGIPENYRIKITEKSGGMKYVHPENEQNYVRVMPGKPYSPNPCQRTPYVSQMKNGKALDKFGNPLPSGKLPEAHVPYNEFVFKE